MTVAFCLHDLRTYALNRSYALPAALLRMCAEREVLARTGQSPYHPHYVRLWAEEGIVRPARVQAYNKK